MVLKQIVECAVILILFFAALASHPFPENDPTDTLSPDKWRARQMTRYRLPNNTIPWQYYIFIEPNMDDTIFSWNGKVSIDIQVVDPTSVLTLHSHRNLVIYENLTELVDSNGTKLTPVEHDRHNEVEFLKLKFDHEISVGNYSLRLKYKGIDNLDYVGFYNASSRFEVMEPGYVRVVGTHFEATTARQAFPCWDEPGLKARFKVAIKHFSNYTAVSNMPEIDHVNTPDGKILTTFDTTPIMSTYLLTFVIANYENVFNEHRNVSVHTSKNVMHAVTRFMNFSPKVVEVMESYTGFSYGLPRIGSVTLPEYTSAATEHWGLVTYSERFFRDSEPKMSLPQKDRIELLIAHELAHSWFGNRVTPLWWDDLWLNEAFATYFQYYIMDQIYDNWGGLGLFIVMNNQELAFPKDTGGGIPIRWTPVSNREIRYLFGPITYKKGAAIVHMFRNVLGDNIFRAGIQKYMAKHSFQAVVADDLMTAFQEAYEENPNKEKPLNVKETMTTWLIQKGYPLINVTRNYTTGDTKVSQISNVFSRNSDKWWVPLTYATKSSLNFSSTSPVSWISNKQEFVNIGGIDKNDWVVFNIQASGYYRVNYDNENWNRLAEYLNTDDYQNIHVLNRATLIDDAFYLAEHQPSDYLRIFYELTKYLKREDEYLPWRTAYNAFKRIEHDLYRTDLHDMFLKYVLGLMHSFVEKIGFEAKDTDNHLTKLARTDLIPWACIAGHFGCSEYAAQRLIKLQENPLKHRLSPDESRWIFCAGLRGLNGSAAQQFNDWAYENEQKLFFATVGCTENHEIHRNILNATLKTNATSETYNAYDTFQDLLTSTDENFNFAVNFFLENHQAMNTAAYSTGWRYILDECIDPNGDLVFHIFCGVTARARSEKLKQVLLLQDVMNNLDIPKTAIENSERIIANAARRAAPYRKFWEELSAENSINGSQINPL